MQGWSWLGLVLYIQELNCVFFLIWLHWGAAALHWRREGKYLFKANL